MKYRNSLISRFGDSVNCFYDCFYLRRSTQVYKWHQKEAFGKGVKFNFDFLKNEKNYSHLSLTFMETTPS